MPERQDPSRQKAGLHGWRAFLVVTGSGLLAGVLVVALIVGVLRLFVSTVENGVQKPQTEGVAPTRGPVTSLEPGSFDLCDSLENMQQFSSVAPARTDSGDAFIDTAQENPGRKMRTIENECVWDVQVGGLVPSQFSLTYTSYIANGGGGSPRKHASERFTDGKADTAEAIASVSSSGELGVLEEGSHYAYGADGERKKIAYIGMVKSSVFSIDIVSTGADPGQQADLEAEYKALIIELLPEVRARFDRVIPD